MPSHSVRIEDEIWEPARVICEQENETVTGVIRMLLMDYALRGEERAVTSIGEGVLAARCGYCHAGVQEPCKNPAGDQVGPHALRVERARRLAVRRRQRDVS
jgi:hypothetical protein